MPEKCDFCKEEKDDCLLTTNDKKICGDCFERKYPEGSW